MRKNGSVLVILLWILALLVLFTLGMGQRAAVSLRIAKGQRDRLIAETAARSGTQYAIVLLKKDLLDSESAGFDSLESCGMNLKGQEAEAVFTQSWPERRSSFKIIHGVAPDILGYGPTDEEGRISLNGLAGIEKNVLFTELFKVKNIPDAEELASWSASWITQNKPLVVPEEMQAIFELYYLTKNNLPEESRKKAQDAYASIQDTVTVFGENKLNINTVSIDALRSLFRAIALANNKSVSKAEALAQDLVEARNQKVFTTADDLGSAIPDSDHEEKEILELSKIYLCAVSNFFRIESLGESEGAKKIITVIYDRRQKKIVYRYEI